MDGTGNESPLSWRVRGGAHEAQGVATRPSNAKGRRVTAPPVASGKRSLRQDGYGVSPSMNLEEKLHCLPLCAEVNHIFWCLLCAISFSIAQTIHNRYLRLDLALPIVSASPLVSEVVARLQGHEVYIEEDSTPFHPRNSTKWTPVPKQSTLSGILWI